MEPDGQKGELSGTNTHTTNDTLQLGERTLRPRRKGDFSSSSGEPSPGEDITTSSPRTLPSLTRCWAPSH